MVGQILAVDRGDEFGESFCATYSGLEDLKGILIHATIGYLDALKEKNLSKQLLIDEGIIDATATTDDDESVVITNYHLRIEAATRLLNSWCREKLYKDKPNFRSIFSAGFVPPPPSTASEIPGPDSILPPGVTVAMMDQAGLDLNYRMDRIPKALPPVLRQLKLQGVHHYAAHGLEFSYQQAQEVVAFLDKVIVSGVRRHVVYYAKWTGNR